MNSMTGRGILGFSLGIGLLLSSCSSGTTVRKDPEAKLTAYHTYNWVTQDQVNELKLTNPKIDFIAGSVRVIRKEAEEGAIKAAIDESLRKQGFVLNAGSSAGARPDFYVTYYGKAKNDDWVSTWTGSTPAVGNVPLVIFPDYNRESARTFHDGVVYLTVYDAKTQKPAWTGNASSSDFERRLEGPELLAAIDRLTKSFKDSA